MSNQSVPVTTLAAAPARRRRFNSSAGIQWAIIIVTVALVLAPLLPLAYQSLLNAPLYNPMAQLTLSNFTHLLADTDFHAAVVNSIVFALGATIVAEVIGVFLAFLVGRTNVFGKVILSTLVIWPLLISDLVKAMGWSFMYGPAGYITQYVTSFGIPGWNLSSMGGMIVVGGVSQCSLAYLYCIGSVRALDPALEDAARTAGASPWRVIVHVILPLMLPAILSSAFFNFVLGLETLSIPLIFGEPARIILFTTFIYERSIQAAVADYGMVAASSSVLVIFVLLTVTIQRRLLGDGQRYVTVAGKGSRRKIFDLGVLRWPLSVLALLIVLGGIGLPLVGVIMQAFSEFLTPLIPFTDLLTLENFQEIFTQDIFIRAMTNSLIIAAVGAGVGVLLIFMISAIVNRSKHPLGRWLEIVVMLPRAVPGMIAGIGFFYASVMFAPLGWTRGTLIMLMAALIMRYLPLGYGAITPNMMQVSPELQRSARAAGASWFRGVVSILMPILQPSMVAAYGLLFLQFFKDYATALFLFTPGTEVVGTVMLSLTRDAKNGTIAALATVQIVVVAVFLFGLARIAKVKLYD